MSWTSVVNDVLLADDTVFNTMHSRIVRKYGDPIAGLGAEDIASDAMIRLLERLSRYESECLTAARSDDGGRLKAYLNTLISHATIDAIRAVTSGISRQMSDEVSIDPCSESESGSPVLDEVLKEEERTILHFLLRRLGPRCRNVITRKGIMKFSFREIAELMASDDPPDPIAPSGVNKLYNRCMKKLYQMLRSDLPEDDS